MTTGHLLLTGLILTSMSAIASEPTSYEHSIRQWRAHRDASLRAPDGWLSLIGLHWLEAGANSLGTAKDNDIVLKAGPIHLGKVIVENGKVQFCSAEDVDVRVAGERVECAPLIPDSQGEPTLVEFGSVSFYVIQRDDRLALRVKDSQAETRVNFTGLEYFPIAKEWRIEARYVPFDEPRELSFPTVLGTIETAPSPGRLVFEKGGEEYDLDVIRYPDGDDFFIIFSDLTSGKSTYPPGRFMHVPFPDENGVVVLDFNKAYNPPCVFTPYATCPLPPPQNKLDLAVTAGELMYGAWHH